MNELPEDAIVDGNVEDSWKRSALNRAAKQASKHTGSQPSAVSLLVSISPTDRLSLANEMNTSMVKP